MMLDTMKCIKITSCAKEIPSYSFYMRKFWQKKRYIDYQKVQVADEIKRGVWKYQVSSNVIDNSRCNYVYNISSEAKN